MNEQMAHILLVEDDIAHAELVRRAFETHWRRFQLSVASNLAEARARLDETSPHLILADLNLPDGRGTDLLPAEGEDCPVPLVVMTAQGDEQVAVESLKAGAMDYVVKSDAVLADTPRIAERTLREWEHITERKRIEGAERLRTQELQTLVYIANILAQAKSFQEKCQEVLEQLAKIAQADWATIRVPDEKGLRLVAAVGPAAEESPPVPFLSGIEGLASAAFREGRLIVENEYAAHPQASPRTVGLGMRSMVLMPIKADGQTVGLVNVLKRESNHFTPESVRLLTAIADGLGVLLEKARIDEEWKRSQEHERLQATALESAANGIVITDRQGTITWVNRAFTSLTGYTAQEALGKNPSLLKSDKQDREFYRNLWDTIVSGEVWRGDIVNRRKDGSLYTEEMTVTPVRDEQGEITNFIAIKQDVSESKLLQEKLVQSQKMEAVGQLGGGIAHDFNNLLTAIQGCAELASDDLPRDHPVQRYLKEIQNSSDRGASITRQLLVFAKRQPMELTVLNLNDLLLDTVWMLRRLIGENIELVGLPAADLGLVKVDQGLMKQVLVNMAVNARDAMPEGGKLTIQTANAVLDPVSAKGWAGLAPGRYVKLSVSDSGIGMDEHTKAHLFEPFFTNKEPGKGSGLGLATCYGIVKEMKGDIRVWSEPGLGATFEIYLPREEAVVEKDPVSDSTRLPRGTETVLVVEDEPSVRRLATQVLQRQGYNVLEADNGEEALRVAEEHGGERIHLLLTDLVMPRMGGRVLAERLTGQFPNIYILFTSGYAGDDLTPPEDPEAAIPFLAKPFLPASLARKVREVLDSASP